MDEEIWIKNPKLLYLGSNYFNMIARYFLIFFIIFLLFSSYKWSYICFIGFIIISIIGYLYQLEKNKNNKINIMKKNISCRRSTINNPMSNLLPLDPNPNLNACHDDSIDKIESNLYYNFYEDENDLNAKRHLRSFITMPITSQLNNRKDFLNYIYQDNQAYCKNNGVDCERYRDIRYNR